MQTTEKKQGLLITPFLNLEIDWKNDYLEYIETNNQNAVTSLLNNSKKSLNNKNTQINAFAQMSNKSLRNRYAVTGL